MRAAVIFMCLVSAAWAHVCLFNPHQRGSMKNVNTIEAPDCGLLTKPCGGRDVPKPAGIQIRKGSSYTVVFQKNQNHFASVNGTATNGYFEISFWTKQKCQILLKIMDEATPALTIYTPSVTMPDGPVGVPATLQMSYVTNNPEVPEGGTFYECSDIELF